MGILNGSCCITSMTTVWSHATSWNARKSEPPSTKPVYTPPLELSIIWRIKCDTSADGRVDAMS